MNENIDLTKILANAPKVLELYTPICGIVIFRRAEKDSEEDKFPVVCYSPDKNMSFTFTKDGKYYEGGECLLFPSKDQRDWSKFDRYKKPIMPFQKVLVRADNETQWRCDLYSHYDASVNIHYCTSGFTYESNNILPYEGNECILGTVTE